MLISKKHLYIIAGLAVVVFLITFALFHKSGNAPNWKGADGTQGVSKNTPVKPSGK